MVENNIILISNYIDKTNDDIFSLELKYNNKYDIYTDILLLYDSWEENGKYLEEPRSGIYNVTVNILNMIIYDDNNNVVHFSTQEIDHIIYQIKNLVMEDLLYNV